MTMLLHILFISAIILVNRNKSILSRIFAKHGVSAVDDGVELEDERDEIYPVHYIDQAAIIRSSLISYTFRYENVLDAHDLRVSLSRLLSSGDWRKLGGRLRRNKEGKLEIHVPRKFSHDRPSFRFSHVQLDLDMDAHPLARRLPAKTGDKPSIHEGCRLFREFSIPSTLPNNINHYLSTDEPLICLHIHSFTDATLVSITFPHLLSDAMGTTGLLQAWGDLLRDPSRMSPRMHIAGAKQDVVAQVGTEGDKTARDTRFVLEDKQTTGLSLFLFIARFIFDIWAHPRIETRHIYLPARFVAHLHREAKEEWMTDGTDNGDTKPLPFLSDGDLITAWGARMVLLSTSSKGSALICNVFDMRRRLLGLSEPSPSSPSSYLQNLILPSTVLLDAEETRSLSTSRIARRVRRALVEQTTDAQVRSLMRIARAWFSRLGTMPLFARWDTTRVFACTNWSKAGLLRHADLFVPAATAINTATTPSSHQRETCNDDDISNNIVKKSKKKPLEFWGTTLSVQDNPRDCFVIYGQDHDGDYWVHAYLRKETWDLIQLELDRYGVA
ncbi:hypothetical protein PG993_003421 [Apiospora rasikravindrae]|uniref:Uncharacterized protein n=1 Tax=Apiospora rasikravindrae TaxID=990691 RepID=A0ABR1TZG3_9PEZI